jgi:hypothetical protein
MVKKVQTKKRSKNPIWTLLRKIAVVIEPNRKILENWECFELILISSSVDAEIRGMTITEGQGLRVVLRPDAKGSVRRKIVTAK